MFSLGGRFGLPKLKVKMESFVRMMHLRRYEERTDDGSTKDETGLSKVENIRFNTSELNKSFQGTDGNNMLMYLDFVPSVYVFKAALRSRGAFLMSLISPSLSPSLPLLGTFRAL